MKFLRPFHGIKAMTFDLDDTLYDNMPIIVQAEKALKAYLQQHYPNAAALSFQDVADIKRALIASDQRLGWDMGELRRHTLNKMLIQDISDETLRQQAATTCFDFFYAQRSNFQVSEAACNVLKTLSESIPLVAITNGNVDVDAIGIGQYFDLALHANLTHPAKPHARMFHVAQDHLQLPAESILHIGDGLINDVLGAYKCGFKTAWLAMNRRMNLANEPAQVLPDVQLQTLEDLLLLI